MYALTDSYQAAFANGVAWNLPNLGIAWFLFERAHRGPALPAARPA
jgi:hypothetical protein